MAVYLPANGSLKRRCDLCPLHLFPRRLTPETLQSQPPAVICLYFHCFNFTSQRHPALRHVLLGSFEIAVFSREEHGAQKLEKAHGDPGPSPAPLMRWIRSLAKTRERKAKSTDWSWRWKLIKGQREERVEGQPRPGCPCFLRKISLLRGNEGWEGLGGRGPRAPSSWLSLLMVPW